MVVLNSLLTQSESPMAITYQVMIGLKKDLKLVGSAGRNSSDVKISI
jgi:hypothetical protein